MDNKKALTPIDAQTVIIEAIDDTPASAIELAGLAANHAARSGLLEDYQERKAERTVYRQKHDINLFIAYLIEAKATPGDLHNDLGAWKHITWGLVDGFKRWQLSKGYAIGSINVRLATIKSFAQLALNYGSLSQIEYAQIKNVKGYKHTEGRNIDERRTKTRYRENGKKETATSISIAHTSLLKHQPDTRHGRRDALLICLMLDHGLRCGEIRDLDVSDFELDAGRLVFYREKVDKTQEHELTPDTLMAAQKYLADVPGEQGPLFLGYCSKRRIDERSINDRVVRLGEKAGLKDLSPHDCRHFWATDAIRNGTDIKALQDAGGWSSPAMPLRYAESANIANKGVKLTATKKL